MAYDVTIKDTTYGIEVTSNTNGTSMGYCYGWYDNNQKFGRMSIHGKDKPARDYISKDHFIEAFKRAINQL